MNYEYLLKVLRSGLPMMVSHYDIVANQMMVMHMTKHKEFKPENYKEEVQGFIDYAKTKLPSKSDRKPLDNTDPLFENVKLLLELQIKAVEAAQE